MKLSTKGRYGLRALIDLAQNGGEQPVSITSISTRQDISERYLEQLMSMLKKGGDCKKCKRSRRRICACKKTGRYLLWGDVLRALEGSLEAVDCAGLEPNGGCSVSDSCVTKYVWKKINDSINQTVDEIKLDQLVKENGKNCRN